MASKQPVDVAKLVASGYGVSRLRSAGVSVADIRAAGFTVEQMHEHLGMHMLLEAGFKLEDFRRANFPLRELLAGFSLEEVLHASPRAYPLNDLMKCVSPVKLKAAGFTASDFYQLGTVTAAELRQLGFTPHEIAEAVAHHPAPAPTSTDKQPPNAVSMAIGESWNWEYTEGRGLFVTYKRVPAAEAEALLAHPIIDSRTVSQSHEYSYDGSGRRCPRCPRCGRLFVCHYKMASGEDNHADEEGRWVCDDASCGMTKVERYTGYGSIFDSQSS